MNDDAFRASLGLRPDDVVIAKLARLSPLKGHEDLFMVAREILSQRTDLKFLLIGDGPLRQQFARRIANEGLQGRFVFAGLVQPEEVPRYLGIADILVHLSRREGLARALPQALAAGKPVVTYASDGAPEVCIEGETGFLIEPGNIQQLTARLLLLAGNPALRTSSSLRSTPMTLLGPRLAAKKLNSPAPQPKSRTSRPARSPGAKSLQNWLRNSELRQA